MDIQIRKLFRRDKLVVLPIGLLLIFALAVSGCNDPDDDDGEIIDGVNIDGDSGEGIDLPTDTVLDLPCEDAGIADQTCVLNDGNNPFRNVATAEFNVNDPEAATKFDLINQIPAGPTGAKARFYAWATALARRPSGENQYYTALALHELFSTSEDPIIREQALKAYKSTWDNFFGSVTVFTCCGEFFPPELERDDTEFAFPINELVLERLVRAREFVSDEYPAGFRPLVPDDPDALGGDAGLIELETQEVITSWGYVYRCSGEGTNRVCTVSVAEF